MNHRTIPYRPRLLAFTLTSLALLMATALSACGDDTDSSGEVGQSADADTADSGRSIDGGSTDSGRNTDAPDAGEDTSGSDTGDRTDTGDGDECIFVPDPSLASGEPSRLAGMTAVHNKWRERVGVERLSWNTTLAASSKAYAEECVWEHSTDRSPDAGFESVGENLAFTTQQLSAFGAERAVQLWVDERFDWDFGMMIGDGDFSAYGHYTQVVWHSTAEVGCGAAYCSNVDGIGNSGTVIVCRYGPAGNYTGRAPYEEQAGACLDLDNDDVLQGDDPDDTDRSVQ